MSRSPTCIPSDRLDKFLRKNHISVFLNAGDKPWSQLGSFLLLILLLMRGDVALIVRLLQIGLAWLFSCYLSICCLFYDLPPLKAVMVLGVFFFFFFSPNTQLTAGFQPPPSRIGWTERKKVKGPELTWPPAYTLLKSLDRDTSSTGSHQVSSPVVCNHP